ncbi:hypothetical protein L1887_36484 [Cichorium endivia]|nr:hypothetical protein L1887_36484 [Cichorium endivia]
MFAFTTQLFSLLLLCTTTTTSAQPYRATDHFLLDCGSSSTTTTSFSRQWVGDESSQFLPSNRTATSFSSTPTAQYPPPPETLYTTARIFNTSSFTYKFPVSQGPKFLHLYFYPATYSDLKANQSFFSVSSNGFSLLTNFSASLTASFLSQTSPQVSSVLKEFIIYVKDAQILNVTFSPSPNSYAFINGIEIVSMPENLHFKAKKFKYIGQISGPVIDNYTALETIYRLNVGGGQISSKDDTGMYRSWDQDDDYVFPSSAKGQTWVSDSPILYTTDTPNYTAPELVYQTQRAMGPLSQHYNLTWILPVDSGFYYMLRLHFCNIIPQYTKKFQMVFTIFINNQTAEHEADPFFWTSGSGGPVFKDFGVYVVDPDGQRSKQDLWLAMHPYYGEYLDGNLNGLEVFKLNMTGNLSSPNPELTRTTQPPRQTYPIKGNKTKTLYVVIIGGVGGGFFLLSVLVLMFLCYRRRGMDKSSWGPTSGESKFPNSLPSDRCHRYTFKEVKVATDEFHENCVIGNGGTERPSMEDVVWGLEFALKLEEGC